MVNIKTVRASSLALKSLEPGLVAVFVGGTSGIALSTAKAFASSTRSPIIYLVGRSQAAADEAITHMKSINSSAQVTFLQSDVTLLRNVDSVCKEIAARTSKLNLLFMTCGQMTMSGRRETTEGLDRKLVLHFYARMRFIDKLLPLLMSAAESAPSTAETGITGDIASPPSSRKLSRVVSVLDPYISVRFGGSGKLDYEDLSLKNSFSLNKCQMHASLMGDFYLEGLAERFPRTSFVHSYPGGVETGLLRDIPLSQVLTTVMRPFMRPFMVPLEESGERHLFAATSTLFAPKAEGGNVQGEDVAVGSDGAKGSGCYWLNWNGEVWPANSKLEWTRADGAVEKVSSHVEDVFQRVCAEGNTYP